MKKYIMSAVLTAITCVAVAQPYQWSIGARFGWPIGIPSFKYNFTEHHTAEGILEFFQSGVQVVGLYEYHGNIKEVQNLRWYAGAGAGVGFFNKSPYYRALGRRVVETRAALTIHPIVGLEYTLPKAPVNFSFDYKPQFDILSGWFGFGGFALGVRYAIK